MNIYGKIIVGIILFAIVSGVAYWYIAGMAGPSADQNGIACTQDAKQCPDGSYVGRVPPTCEFAACPAATSTATSTADNGSGVSGIVLLGPTCPVERIPPDPNCADKPYATLIAIFPASDPVHAKVITKSAADGTFSASLPPGDYTIGAGDSNLPRCDHPTVTVPANGYATTTVRCDTGIR